MCALALEPKSATERCRHLDAEVLGFDANAEFLRCKACGQLLVRQGGRVWAIRPARNPVISIR